MPAKRKTTSEAPPAKRGKVAPTNAADMMPSTITRPQFDDALERYPSVVPVKLKELDLDRYESIPRHVKSRQPKHLTHSELVTLVEWKLKHGTFRPNLLAMAKQHQPAKIVEITTDAFEQDPVDGLKTLSTLRGIGPATASLLLSCTGDAPFFSDELYRWMMLDEGGGWNRKIGYTPKEYSTLLERVKAFRKRFEVSAMDMEKVAYVLGRS